MRRKKLAAVATVAMLALGGVGLAITGTAHAGANGQELRVCGEGSNYRQITLEGINQRGEQTKVSTEFFEECTAIPGHWWVGDVKVTLSQPPRGEHSATHWCKVPKELQAPDFVECRFPQPQCATPDVDAINQFLAQAAAKGESETGTHEKLLEKWCGLSPVAFEPGHGRELDTKQTDVEWSNLRMFWSKSDKSYIATATWKWTRQGFLDEDLVTCRENDIGNDDGVAIRFSGGDINIIDDSAVAWGNPAKDEYDNGYGTMDVPASRINEYGVGFMAQDTARRLYSQGACTNGQYDYNMYAGAITINFKKLNGCKKVQIFTLYSHTWDTAKFTGIGAGIDSFSVSWETDSNSWDSPEKGPEMRICEEGPS